MPVCLGVNVSKHVCICSEGRRHAHAALHVDSDMYMQHAAVFMCVFCVCLPCVYLWVLVCVCSIFRTCTCVCVSYLGESTEEKISDICSQEASSVISEDTKHTEVFG